jgi:hypothetical protein
LTAPDFSVAGPPHAFFRLPLPTVVPVRGPHSDRGPGPGRSGRTGLAEVRAAFVDPAVPLRQPPPAGAAGLVGVNVNYLLDDDANRTGARPLAEALRELGAGTLRYPGGAKSDVTLWSEPPYAGARPRLARLGPREWPSDDARVFRLSEGRFVTDPLDFDEFMGLCRTTGAVPVLVVAHDAAYRPATPGGSVPCREDLVAAAVAWVRYANLEKRYGVKYFEIGNESYLDTYDGGSRAEDYARDVVLFSPGHEGRGSVHQDRGQRPGPASRRGGLR